MCNRRGCHIHAECHFQHQRSLFLIICKPSIPPLSFRLLVLGVYYEWNYTCYYYGWDWGWVCGWTRVPVYYPIYETRCYPDPVPEPEPEPTLALGNAPGYGGGSFNAGGRAQSGGDSGGSFLTNSVDVAKQGIKRLSSLLSEGYSWLKPDPGFRERYDEALEENRLPFVKELSPLVPIGFATSGITSVAAWGVDKAAVNSATKNFESLRINRNSVYIRGYNPRLLRAAKVLRGTSAGSAIISAAAGGLDIGARIISVIDAWRDY